MVFIIKSNKEQFIEKAKSLHGDLFDYSLFKYINSITKGEIICKEHGPFEQKPIKHLNWQGCKKCAIEKNQSENKYFFIEKAKNTHGELYDYSLSVYKNAKEKIQIICKKHGMFEQTANNHILLKHGCSKCQRDNNKSTKNEFIKKASLIHNNIYDYSDFIYVNSKMKGTIICKKHGQFEQKPNGHLSGDGCRKCFIEKLKNSFSSTKNDFVRKSIETHDDLYNYDNFIYVNSGIHGIITCKKHGDFLQIPDSHLAGHGCPKCCRNISKLETKWLDSLNVPLRQHFIQTKTRKINVDGYDPLTNIVYQFHGDFYHGNPAKYPPCYWNKKLKKFAYELYEKTLENNKLIRESGYNLLVIWETDWLKICTRTYSL